MLKTHSRSLAFIILGIAVLLSLACNIANRVISVSVATPTPEVASSSPATPLPTLEELEEADEVVQPTPTLPPETDSQPAEPLPSLTPTSAPASITPTVAAASFEPCESETCTGPGTFNLSRPIGPEGRNTIDHSRRFGTYRASIDRANRGVQFLNSLGTPVLAVADGVVVVAGDDSKTVYGYYANAFGNLVILKHDLPEFGVPIYTLYAHLSQINVAVDDVVSRGQEIGLVGNSGDVAGSTLYFEIRWGENNYQAPQNPELWLESLTDDNGTPLGALAGRILDGNGNDLSVSNIVIERLAGPGQAAQDTLYLETYNSKSLKGLPPHGESFALGSLPAGEYQITFWMDGFQQAEITVEPGKLTFVNMVVE